MNIFSRTNQTPIQLNVTLAEALNFTQSTLKANRNGRMTHEQTEIVRQQSYARLRKYAGKLLIRLGILVAYVGIAYVINPFATTTVVLLIGGCLFGLPAFFQTIDIRDAWSDLRTDINQREVKMVVGRVKFAQYGEKARHLIHIERQTFHDLPEQVLSVFTAGERYRIYYSAKTKIILSAEPIDPNARIDDSWEDLH